MADRTALERVKRATVALAVVADQLPDDPREPPHLIIGSGFCIHPRGVVATCEHVIAAFMKQSIRDLIAQVPEEDRKHELWPLRDVQMAHPQALFFQTVSPTQVAMFPAPMETAVAKTDADVGLIRVAQHAAFKEGYPYLELEDFAQIYEGMEVATCGFPLGNYLQAQLGTVTSSFTRGILSSIAPAPGIAQEFVDGFQLDITATYGNSGGPVFNWATGKVFGILPGGPTARDGKALHGFARAEPVYKIATAPNIQELIAVSIDDIRRKSGQ